MQKYEKWLKEPTRFLSMTGYDIEAFQRLLPHFEVAHDGYLSRHEIDGTIKKRVRRFVIYQNSPLNNHAERLCFILFYIKHNPVQEVQAEMFEMDQGYCNAYIHGLQHILDLALLSHGSMPARTDKTLQIVLKTLENKEILHDGTEREVPRPQDETAQKDYYSGKKKKHAVKNAVIGTMVGFIIFVSQTYAGRVHDKRMAEDYTIPSGFILWQDTGYQGYAPEGVDIVQPTKKPKGKELSEEQKHLNSAISSYRVRIEHFIGGLKRYRIVKDECRAYKNEFRDAIIGTCAGLYNFRITTKYPQYVDNQ
jgi:hypothetical protein